MTHFQGSITGQNEAIGRLPKTFSVKAVMRPDLLKEARALVPGIHTVLRHWNDNYQWSTDWQTNLTLARQWFSQFIDGTFREQYAPYVMSVSERNEYDSHVLPPEVRATRIMWMQAVSWVWNKEYKNQLQQYRPGLPPIQLVLCDTAPGNDLPREAAVLALDNDDILGYHPYIAVYSPNSFLHELPTRTGAAFRLPSAGEPLNERMNLGDSLELYQVDMGGSALSSEPELVPIGERSAGDWQWCSGRWHFMEQAWGLKPRWAFTEAGPIRDQTGTLGLDPLGGWRELGSREHYATTVTSWMKDVQTTPAYQEGRILGYHLFTVPGGGQWQHFTHDLGDLNSQVDVIVREWKPGTATPAPNPLPGLRLGSPFREAFVVSSPFDSPRSYGKHEGVDYVATSMQGNELIHCGYDGTVDLVAYSATGYGKYVRTRHTRNGGTFWLYYAHLDTQIVTQGQVIKKGDPVGEVGSTGNSTGPHLHLTLRVPGYGLGGYVVPDVVNPDPYVDRWQPEPPPPPPTGENMLINGSFEEGWRDDGNSQIPNGWNWYHKDNTTPNPYDPNPWSQFGLPECRVLNKSNLPASEQGFVLDGSYTFKPFRGNGAWWAGFTQTVNLAAPQTLTINAFGDLVKAYEGNTKVWANDPQGRDGLIRLGVSGTFTEWQSVTPGKWNRLIFNVPAGDNLLAVEFMCPFALKNSGFFLDDWSMVTATPPRTYKRLAHLVPQNATMAEYAQVTASAFPLRQTVLFSIDDAMITHPNLTERRVIVWGDVSRHGAFTDRASFEAWIVANYPPLPMLVYRTF